MPARVSAPIDHLVAAARENFYKNLLDIGGATMVIVPTADPTYGALTAATFTTMGAAAITVTPSVALSAFDNPVGQQGVMPYIDLNGAASGGNLLTVTADAAIENVFDGGGVVGAWVYQRSQGDGHTSGRIYNKSDHQIYVGNESADKTKITFNQAFTDGGAAPGTWRTTSTELDNDTIALVIVEYNSTSASNDPVISMDNTDLAITESATPTGTRDTDAGVDIQIGNLSGANRTWDGWISTFFAIDATITAAQRRAIYELGRGAFNY